MREAISANERGISWKQIAIDMRINAKTLRKYIAGIGYKSNGYRRCVPIEKITQAIDMRNKGVAWKDVSASVGYSRRHLQDLIKKYQEAA